MYEGHQDLGGRRTFWNEISVPLPCSKTHPISVSPCVSVGVRASTSGRGGVRPGIWSVVGTGTGSRDGSCGCPCPQPTDCSRHRPHQRPVAPRGTLADPVLMKDSVDRDRTGTSPCRGPSLGGGGGSLYRFVVTDPVPEGTVVGDTEPEDGHGPLLPCRDNNWEFHGSEMSSLVSTPCVVPSLVSYP